MISRDRRGETKTGIKKDTCFLTGKYITHQNRKYRNGFRVQVKAELFGKTNMERGPWFKYRTEKDGGTFAASRNVTGLQMPRDTELSLPGAILSLYSCI